jgi:hypothetical protein
MWVRTDTTCNALRSGIQQPFQEGIGNTSNAASTRAALSKPFPEIEETILLFYVSKKLPIKGGGMKL